MSKKRLFMDLTEDQRKSLEYQAQQEGFATVTSYIKSKFFTETSQTAIIEDFRLERNVKRTFRCPESVWEKIRQETKNPSDFVRQAILEKLQNNSH